MLHGGCKCAGLGYDLHMLYISSQTQIEAIKLIFASTIESIKDVYIEAVAKSQTFCLHVLNYRYTYYCLETRKTCTADNSLGLNMSLIFTSHYSLRTLCTHLMDAFLRLRIVQSHREQEYEEVWEVVWC